MRARAGAERPLERHERVVAVDHHPRALRPGERGKLVDRFEQAAAAEQDLADEDQVMLAATARRRGSARRNLSNGSAATRSTSTVPASSQRASWRRALWNSPSLVSTRAGPERRGHGGEQPDEEVVGVGREDDGARIAAAELARDMRLRLGPDLAHHPVPLAVGEPGRVVPASTCPSKLASGHR